MFESTLIILLLIAASVTDVDATTRSVGASAWTMRTEAV